jgi:hypothetical protein
MNGLEAIEKHCKDILRCASAEHVLDCEHTLKIITQIKQQHFIDDLMLYYLTDHCPESFGINFIGLCDDPEDDDEQQCLRCWRAALGIEVTPSL